MWVTGAVSGARSSKKSKNPKIQRKLKRQTSKTKGGRVLPGQSLGSLTFGFFAMTTAVVAGTENLPREASTSTTKT
jgi:hypothetical protein